MLLTGAIAVHQVGDELLLSADDPDITEVADRRTIHLANMAAAANAIFARQRLHDIDTGFLAAFLAEQSEMSDEAANLFFSLKTQLVIHEFEHSGEGEGEGGGGQDLPEKDPSQVLNVDGVLELGFAANIRNELLERHPGVDLTDGEQRFIDSCQTRRATLLAEVENAPKEGPEFTRQDGSDIGGYSVFILNSLAFHLADPYSKTPLPKVPLQRPCSDLGGFPSDATGDNRGACCKNGNTASTQRWRR